MYTKESLIKKYNKAVEEGYVDEYYDNTDDVDETTKRRDWISAQFGNSDMAQTAREWLDCLEEGEKWRLDEEDE